MSQNITNQSNFCINFKMNRFFLFLCVLLLSFGLISCSSSNEERKGIRTVGDETCYQINLENNTVEDYFSLVKPDGQIVVTPFSFEGKPEGGSRSVVVYYSQIEEGGWVAYSDNLAIYFPSEVSESNVQMTCSAFLDITADECYTIDEVREYLPWI